MPSSNRAKLPDWDVEPKDADNGDERDVDEADDDERRALAKDEFHRPDGRHHDLLDRADLLFAHDRHPGQHEAHEHDEDRHDAGDKVVPAFEVLVEPRPGPQVGAADGNGAPGLAQGRVENEFAVVGACDDGAVIEDKARGVRVGAVHDELDGRGFAAAQACPKPELICRMAEASAASIIAPASASSSVRLTASK